MEEVGAKLYPELIGGVRQLAMANLLRYFEIAVAIAEEQARARLGLTVAESTPTIKERSNVDLRL